MQNRPLHIFRHLRWLAIVIAALFGPQALAGEITVFAAASLKNALEEVATQYEEKTGDRVLLSFAGSSVLARQIELEAPADIFISANPGWMDYLEKQGKIAAGTRFDLLSNRLVLIATGSGTPVFELDPEFDLAGRLGDGFLAMALTEAVPAGIYGKAALQRLKLWDSVADKIAQADNVRAALALVALGEAPLGIVYATDAMAEPRVAVIATFPAESHPAILYPAASIADRVTPQTSQFMTFLQGPSARAVFESQGFTVIEGDKQ